MTWHDLTTMLAGHNTVLLSSHQNPDGDCIGSQLAFYWYLTSTGKKVVIYNKDPVPERFRFLADAGRFTTTLPAEHFDLLAVLDSSSLHRLGWDTSSVKDLPCIDIDHHRDNSRFGTVSIVDSTAAATGEIIYRLFDDNNIDFPVSVAEALYTAIITDTGGFRFPNTTADVLRICADLVARGTNPAKVYERVYASHSPQGLDLQSRIWSSLQYHLGGRVCSMSMPKTLYGEIGAQPGDSEGMVDNTITAAGVEVGFLAKYTDTETHFSLRSRGRIDVGLIAQNIPHGGGHSGAAGCTIPAPYPQALDQMLVLIARELL
ncbi:MAG: bifunctional oligoribonuclease/PAP phosphatase NrnA [Chitinispirillaceae bacterium]|jgi:phosphoesterase RecJ-like protein|nr:bifunctional oligoribonuclease/PAP phosphatase NrnA [Chitinispirillaceae bacterium]